MTVNLILIIEFYIDDFWLNLLIENEYKFAFLVTLSQKSGRYVITPFSINVNSELMPAKSPVISLGNIIISFFI